MNYSNFSEEYRNILINTEEKIKSSFYKELKEIDILIAILKGAKGGIKEILEQYGITENLISEVLKIKKSIFGEIDGEKRKGTYNGMSDFLKKAVLISIDIATSSSKNKVSLEDFLIALLRTNSSLKKTLIFFGINISQFEKCLIFLNKNETIDGIPEPENLKEFIENNKKGKVLGEREISEKNFENEENGQRKNLKEYIGYKENISSSEVLKKYTQDLTQKAKDKEFGKIISRDKEIESIKLALKRKTKNNPVLVGEPGVGKTAIVEGFANKIITGEIPLMKNQKILSLNINTLLSGAIYRGEFEERIEKIIKEASKVENGIILFIDEIHTVIGGGGITGISDVANILKPAMGRGKIKIIGATTPKEYQKYIEKDSALERRFQKITINEPSLKDSIKIISGLKKSFEKHHNLVITDKAIEKSVELSDRYIVDRYLPDKAIDLIDEACCMKEIKIGKSTKVKVTQIDIQNIISTKTGIPINVGKNEIQELKKLPKNLKKYLIGQDKIIDSLCDTILVSKVGIGDLKKPIGSFLFLGPTGVGKTELVKVLAREFYKDKNSLIKIDMSEYSDKTGVSKLIGASAGYVGYEESGFLTEKVRRKPYSVLLFDEIEKGHLDVYNLLLQILDEGSLTDNKGRSVNFKNTIIIMTSNIGQEKFSQEGKKIGFGVEELPNNNLENIEKEVLKKLPRYFSKEFLNRIDKTLIFCPLDEKSIGKIVSLNMKKLVSRVKKSKELNLIYDKKIINFITKNVYNPVYGAREIKRFLSENIESIIAKQMLKGKIKNNTITLYTDKKEIKIK